MKKKILMIAAAVAALVLVAVLLIWGSTDAQLLWEVKRAEKASGEGYDLSGALEILSDKKSNDARAHLEKLSDGLAKTESGPLAAAILAGKLTEEGVMTREDGSAAAMTALMLSPIGSGWTSHHLSELPTMLSCLTPDALTQVLLAAEMSEEFVEIQAILGEQTAGRLTMQQLTEVCSAYAAAGQDVRAFAEKAWAGIPQADVAAALAAETDPARRAALAQAYGMALTLPGDVLSYLAAAREAGVSAVECYPDGAVVTWDLSHLATSGRMLGWQGDSPRYLVVHLAEAEEKLEKRKVSKDLTMEDWEHENAFEEDYESNNGHWLETVTVRIDTAAMDAIPAEFIPASLAEMDALVVLDAHYTAWGVLRHQVTSAKSATGGVSISKFDDYRTYAAVQTVDVYDAQGQLQYSFAQLVTAPDISRLEENPDLGRYQSVIKEACIPAVDEEWMAEQYTELMALLAQSGGDLKKAIDAAKYR